MGACRPHPIPRRPPPPFPFLFRKSQTEVFDRFLLKLLEVCLNASCNWELISS